jgi:hypothetical protein
MAVIQFRSPVTTPLHRKGQCVPSSDDFCVTQQFDDPDYYWSNIPNPPNPLPTHRATDIGNFRCGYPIVAMAAGTAWRVQDNASALGAASNALGIVIDHGSGVKSAYWHLASWTAANGAWVNGGQEIGKLGSTGLGATCHTHIEMTLNAVKIDPEPYMFGAPLDTAAPSEDDEPMYNPPDVLAIYGQGLVTRAGARLRENRGTSYPVLTEFPAGVQLTATARVIRAGGRGADRVHPFLGGRPRHRPAAVRLHASPGGCGAHRGNVHRLRPRQGQGRRRRAGHRAMTAAFIFAAVLLLFLIGLAYLLMMTQERP